MSTAGKLQRDSSGKIKRGADGKFRMNTSGTDTCCCDELECCGIDALTNGVTPCTHCSGISSAPEWTATVADVESTTLCQDCGSTSAKLTQQVGQSADQNGTFCVDQTSNITSGERSCTRAADGFNILKSFWNANDSCTGTSTTGATGKPVLRIERTATGFRASIRSTIGSGALSIVFWWFDGEIVESLCCPSVLEFTNSITSFGCTTVGNLVTVHVGRNGTIVATPCCA
jgi:hypothetical protein